MSNFNILNITEPRPGVHLVEFNDKRIVTIPRVQKFGDELCARLGAILSGHHMVIDFSNVEISCFGLAKLRTIERLLSSKKCILVIINTSELTDELIKIAHLDNLFDCRKNAGGARAVVDDLAKSSIQRH